MYRWSGTFSDLKSFLVSFSDPIRNIGGWSVVCEVDCEIDTCLRVKSFPNFKSEGVWSIDSELCPAGRSLCLPVWFCSSTSAAVRGCRWIVVSWLVHPTQQSSLLMFILHLPWYEVTSRLPVKVSVHKEEIREHFAHQSVSSSVKESVLRLLTGLHYFCGFPPYYFVDTLSERKGENASIFV